MQDSKVAAAAAELQLATKASHQAQVLVGTGLGGQQPCKCSHTCVMQAKLQAQEHKAQMLKNEEDAKRAAYAAAQQEAEQTKANMADFARRQGLGFPRSA